MVKVKCVLTKAKPATWLQILTGSIPDTEQRDVFATRDEARKFQQEGWAVEVKLCRSKLWCGTELGYQKVDAPCSSIYFDDALPIIRSNWP